MVADDVNDNNHWPCVCVPIQPEVDLVFGRAIFS